MAEARSRTFDRDRDGKPRSVAVLEVAQPGACRCPEVSARWRVPRGEGVHGENLGVVLAGLVTQPGKARRGPVAKIGLGEGSDQAGLPGVGSQLDAGAQRLAGAAVVETFAQPRQRGETNGG